MLDNILLEWELEDDDDMGEGVRKECQEGDVLGLDVDECIRTITCEGNCSSSSNSELPHRVPALEVGRGENEKDMKNRIVSNSLTVHSDGYEDVNECVQTVHCAGDCTDLHFTTNPGPGGGCVQTSLNLENKS